MANLKIRLSAAATGLVLLAIILGWFARDLAEQAPGDVQLTHLALAAFVFVGLCGVVVFGMLERALSPVLTLVQTFGQMRSGDLDPRLPEEGPEEMREVARAFNEMLEELELRIREITAEKQSSERGRQFVTEQLAACRHFQAWVDSAPVGIVLADTELNVVYQNTASGSGFLQLADYIPWNASVVVGRPMWMLYGDHEESRDFLSDPDRLPFETNVSIGPYTVRFLACPAYDGEEEYVGPALLWEVLADSQPDDAEEGLVGVAAEEATELPDAGARADLPEAAVAIDEEVVGRGRRSAALVGRSVRLLSDRLRTVRSMVEALCHEGENLHRCLEEAKQRTQNAAYLSSERSEAIWEAVDEMNGANERARASTMLVRRLQKSAADSGALASSIGQLADAMAHLVVEARLEAGRARDGRGDLKPVVDEIQRLGREAGKARRDVEKRMTRIASEVDGVLSLLEEDRREVRAGTRTARRAENALGRIERDLSDVNERTNLLTEMAAGQSEIGSHISEQMARLSELVDVTTRVVGEQTRALNVVWGTAPPPPVADDIEPEVVI